MTELQEEVEELRKLTWMLTKKISELAVRLREQQEPPHPEEELNRIMLSFDDDDKGSD